MEPTEQELDVEVGDLQAAEYIVFLLALDTYAKYLEEHSELDATDSLVRKAINIIRRADQNHKAAILLALGEELPSTAHKRMIDRAFNTAVTQRGLGRRALFIRSALSLGGAATLRMVFKNSPIGLREIRKAMDASAMDDPDKALDAFAAITMRNKILEHWIDAAAEAAGSGTPQNVVLATAPVAAAAVKPLMEAQVAADAAPIATDESKAAKEEHVKLLNHVEIAATESAKRVMNVSKEPDLPPTKSEVVGIAAAAVAAAMSDPEVEANIPEPLRKLDPEQRAAALSDGRLLVAAGAGAGKSTTLVSRIAYLVKDRSVNSGRIMACSFNTKAAKQLEGKIQRKIGSNNVKVGTMHSIFKQFVTGNKVSKGLGTAEEQAMLQHPRLIAPKGKLSGLTMSIAIRNMWAQCNPDLLVKRYGYPLDWMKEIPKAKQANLYMNKWRGNEVSLEEAKKLVKSKVEAQAVVWYDMYLGIKGDIPGWKPPCETKAYKKFMHEHRKGGERLGDMEDMQGILLRILQEEPEKRERLQKAFDHILVDEAQDLNIVQHKIFELISAHITPGSGKSIWMIGDDKQCIYQFRGSKPELFIEFTHKNDWNVKLIRTNYRSEPEIVEAANRLSAYNEGNIPMECRAAPTKSHGSASIVVATPPDTVSAALDKVDEIGREIAAGAKYEQYAVLARTNAELNDFETACIINEIPYIKKGGKGFLEAAEAKAVSGYIDLATGDSYESMRKSLAAVLMYPDRGIFGKYEDILSCIDEALGDVARYNRVDKSQLNPTILLDRGNATILADALKRPIKAKIKSEYAYNKIVESLADNLMDLAGDLRAIQRNVKENPGQKTSEFLNTILDGVSSTVSGWDSLEGRPTSETKTLREQITYNMSLFSDDEEGEEEEDPSEEDAAESLEVNEAGQVVNKDNEFLDEFNGPSSAELLQKADAAVMNGLGAVKFLFKMAVPNSSDLAASNDPTSVEGFIKKVARYRSLSDKLRIDPEKWEREHGDEPAPAVTLSTIHKVKGAEWDNVTVLMPKGTFPMERKPKEGEPPPDPEEEAKRMIAERNLAYVALTRAAHNLDILCPARTARGPGGISQFVNEAGLHVGQNVPKESVDVQSISQLPAMEKTAGYDVVPDDLMGLASYYESLNDSNWKVK